MHQSHIDNHFRSSLANHQVALDKDALWAAINKETNRPIIGAGWKSVGIKGLGGLALLSLIVSSILWLYPSAHPLNSKAPNALPAVNATSINNPNNNQNNNNQNNNPALILDTNEIAEANHPEYQAPKSDNGDKSNDVTHKSPDSNSNTLRNNIIKDDQAQSNNNNTSINTINNSPRPKLHTKAKPFSSSNALPQNLSLEKSSSPWLDNVYDINATITQETRKIEKGSLNQSLVNQDVLNQSDIHQALTPVGSIQKMKPLNTLALTNNPLVYERALPNNKKKVECYEYGKKKKSLSLEVYSSLDGVNSRLSADNESQEYLTERDRTQKQREGYRAGLRAKFNLLKNVNIKVGLEAGMIRERFQRETSESVTEIMPDQLLEIIMQGDSTIYIYGDAPVTTLTTTTWDIANSYRSLDIPITLGYELDFKKFTCGIDLGASYNILYDFKGYLINPADTPVASPDYFRANIKTSLIGGLSINYAMNDNYYLFGFTSMKYNMSNINNASNSINQKNTRLGLGFGLGYILR